MKTIILTGGGTAGHVMPNLALIPELRKCFDKIIYIGTNGIEKKLASEYKDIQFIEIEAVKLVRKLTFKNLSIPYRLIKSINSCKKILKELDADIVFSKGGYVSIPVAIAASKLKIPVITHESDLSLGLANRVISNFSTLTLTSFEETASGKKKFCYAGSPVREQIFRGEKEKVGFDLNPNKKTLLFFGGSLGAKAINEALYEALPELKDYNILHITGKGKLNDKILYPNYHAVEYTNHIEDFFASADFVISRAGANSVFELLALSKPTLLIPLPKAESRGDQIDNANYFFKRGMCEILLQEELNKNNLLNSLKKLEKNEKNIKNNIKNNKLSNPNKKIVEIICQNIKK